MSILSSYAPNIEIYSIDEAFLSFSGFELYDLNKMGLDMRDKILKWTGIPTSVGFAPTKALAKVANKIAKKFTERTGGVYIIDTEEKRIKALKWLTIDDVWGIGRKHAKRLQYQSIKTAYDFVQMSDSWIKKNMSVVGLRLKRELEGIPSIPMEETKAKQSIATTRSFDKHYTTFDELKERIVTFAANCAEKLRQQNSCCNALMVFVHTNYFREDLDQYAKNSVIKLPFATNSSIEIATFATEALQQIFVSGYHYKKAGVIVMDIVPEMPNQLNLFINSNPKHKALMAAIDKINNEIGQQKVMLAAQDPARRWKMKQEKLSPRYTTKINEILTIKAE
jgi:DNA polymerase V